MRVKGFNITRWVDHRGISILYPETMIGLEKNRGGCFIAAPVFGTPPTTGLWRMTNLARHGLVRLLRNGDNGEVEVSEFTEFKEEHLFKGDAQFPWTHKVSARMFFRNNPYRLVHVLCIERPPAEDTVDEMPLSFGLHPYFATHGEPFTIMVGGKVIADHTTDLSNSLQNGSMLGITLETAYGTIEIVPNGYTQWNLWTDDNGKYVCIEPTRGRLAHDELRLLAGQEVTAYCEMLYTPR